MLKVVIIDDEALVRAGLKSIIDWNAEGYDICGEASNGKTGTALVKQLRPDIVITDIKMPLVDGFEMIKALTVDTELEVKPQYIILSGYDDFEYAKTALKLQACDYIIKMEMDGEVLLSSLSIAREKIVKQRGETQGTADRQNAERERMLRHIILNDADEDTEYGAGLKPDESVFIAYMELGTYSEQGDTMFLPMINITNEISNSYFTSYSLRWPDNGVVIVCITDKTDRREINQMADSMCRRLREMLFNYFNIDVTLCVSGVHGSIRDLPLAMKECLECSGGEPVSFYETAAKSDTGARIILRAKAYISEHYREKLSLNDVADHLGISVTYLSAIFKKNAGKGFNEYITEVKISEAQRLIGENKYKLYEISEMLGFENSFYFSKVFKKVTGMSPSDYAGVTAKP